MAFVQAPQSQDDLSDESSAEQTESSWSSSEEEGPGPDYEAQYRVPKVHDVVQAEKTATGMKGKEPGAEYAGEFNQRGWRAASAENKTKADIVTRVYSEQEQRANQLTMNESGQFARGDGPVGQQPLGYAMDPSGRMVAFDEQIDILQTTAPDGTTRREETTQRGTIMNHGAGPGQRLEVNHHTTALGADVVMGEDGKPVLDAAGKPLLKPRAAASPGFVTFDLYGKIVKISNSSGHYKPEVDYLVQAVEHLLVQGAFFKDELADASGMRIGPYTKEAQLYKATKNKIAEANALTERLADVTQSLQAATEKNDADAQAALGKTLTELTAELEKATAAVSAAKGVLSRRGIGPSNEVRSNVGAEYIKPKDGMTGAEVRSTQASWKEIMQFLQSGGGNDVQWLNKKVVRDAIVATGKVGPGDLERLEALQAKPLPWSRQDKAEVTRLQQAFDNAKADVEAEARSTAAGSRADADDALDVGGALEGLGVPVHQHNDDASPSDFDSESESEWSSEDESESTSTSH